MSQLLLEGGLQQLYWARAAPAQTQLPSRWYSSQRRPLRHSCSAVTRELTDWVAEANIQTESLSFDTFDGERGLGADVDIPAYHTLVSVPVQRMFKAYPLQPNPLPHLCPRGLWSDGPWYFKLALQLLNEAGKGSKSAFYPYLQALPSSFDTPLHWSEDEMNELHYPCLNVMVKAQFEVFAVLYNNLKKCHEEKPDLRDLPSWEQFCWAMQAVRSRAFGGPFPGSSSQERLKTFGVVAACAAASVGLLHLPIEQVANGFIAAVFFNLVYDFTLSKTVQWHTMLPIIDFINHKSSAQSEVAYEYFGDRMSAKCSIPFKKGEQVFINYGEQTNDSLLQFYGFFEPGNPMDVYVLQDFAPRAMAAATALSLPLQKRPKQREGEEQLDARLSRKGPDAEVLQLLCSMLGLTLQPETHAPAYKLLAHVCQEEADAWPTTVQQDRELLQSERGLGGRRLLALRFRIEKKTVLAECLKSYMRQANPANYDSDKPSRIAVGA